MYVSMNETHTSSCNLYYTGNLYYIGNLYHTGNLYGTDNLYHGGNLYHVAVVRLSVAGRPVLALT